MATLKSFDLTGNKQSFANWISNLSPCETPFVSMIGKEGVDQVQYSWQTDRLSAAGKNSDGSALTEVKEGDAYADAVLRPTVVVTNFTKIFRKAVRVSDTTKQVSLWGRGSELGYQMEKAGMELKRDVEHYLLNTTKAGSLGTASVASECAGVQKLVAAAAAADPDTGAVVHKVITYAADAGTPVFTKDDVFGLTYNLYLAGARANKIMVHPMHVHVFSDFIADAGNAKAKPKAPHLHRMFDGLDTKYNAFVKKIRDPLGQDFEIIPNRFMPKNQLFFFNEADWTQMVLRSPEKSELGRTGSTQKFMIEMEVGLRHRNPYASGILEFNQVSKVVLKDPKVVPSNVIADGSTESTVSVVVEKADGSVGSATEAVTFTGVTVNDDGTTTDTATVTGASTTVSGGVATATAKVKHTKGARVKVKAQVTSEPDPVAGTVEAVADTYETRDA